MLTIDGTSFRGADKLNQRVKSAPMANKKTVAIHSTHTTVVSEPASESVTRTRPNEQGQTPVASPDTANLGQQVYLTDSPDLAESFVRGQLLRLFFTKFVWFSRIGLVAGGLAAFLLRDYVNTTYLYAWTATLFSLSVTGEFVTLFFERSKPEQDTGKQWPLLGVSLSGGLGIAWGAAGLAAFVVLPSDVQIATLVLVISMSVCGALMLAPLVTATYTLVMLTSVPMIAGNIFFATSTHYLNGILLMGLGLALARAGCIYHNVIVTALLLREDLRRAQSGLVEAKSVHKTIRERLQFEIKDRTSVEADLTKAKQVAEQAARVKTDFLATMSHEIRTPMNGVLGMTELLLNTELNKKQRRFAETIHRSGASLLTIINDILDFSKIEAGKLELNPVAFNLRQLAEDTVGLFAERADRKGLALGFVYQAGAHETFRGDEERIRQILNNLIGNAVKFTERGEVVLRVTVLQELATGCRLRIEVRDTGIGIKPEAHTKIFDSFAQADGSTTRKYGGTGLGLAICKQLVQIMAGEIGVESTLGKGSTFWMELPLPKVVGLKARGDAQTRDSLSDVRVLVADDNSTGREMLAGQLGLWGAKYEFSSRDDALQTLREAAAAKRAFDVLVLDESSSSKLTLKMTENISHYPELANLRVILLLSARNLEETAQLMMAGVDGYVDKPVRQSELYSCFIKVLGLSDQMSATRTSVTGPHPEHEVVLRGNVLIAEDNPVNQELASQMLEAMGCRVHVVSNGREVVEALWKSPLDRLSDPYDLILMDCQMPEMDGFEATAKIRSVEQKSGNKKRIPIIALTANAMAGDRENCLAAGMDDYLSKPFSYGQLNEVVRRWLKDSAAVVEVVAEAAVEVKPPPEQPAPAKAMTNAVASLNPAALDKIRALQREGQPDIVRKVASMFLDSSVKLVQGLEEAMMVSDAEKVRHNAHSLKSSSASLGAELLAQLCQELEQMGKERRLDNAFSVLTKLQVEYKLVCEALQQMLRQRAA